MSMQQLTEILYFSALIFFNLFCISGVIISVFVMFTIRQTSKKVNEGLDLAKDSIKQTNEKVNETLDSIKESSINIGEIIGSISATIAPFMFRKQTKEKSLLSKVLSFFA